MYRVGTFLSSTAATHAPQQFPGPTLGSQLDLRRLTLPGQRAHQFRERHDLSHQRVVSSHLPSFPLSVAPSRLNRLARYGNLLGGRVVPVG